MCCISNSYIQTPTLLLCIFKVVLTFSLRILLSIMLFVYKSLTIVGALFTFLWILIKLMYTISKSCIPMNIYTEIIISSLKIICHLYLCTVFYARVVDINMFRYIFIFTNTYILYCRFTMCQYALCPLHITPFIIFVLFCVSRLSHIYVCTLYITNVFTFCTFCTDLCFICMYLLHHSRLCKVLYMRGLIVSIMYVCGAPISCSYVTHLVDVPTFLLYIHFVRYASLLFFSLHIFSPVYILLFYAVTLVLSQIMCCFSVCNRICANIFSYPLTHFYTCMYTQCNRYNSLLVFAYFIYFILYTHSVSCLFVVLSVLPSLCIILYVCIYRIDMIMNRCSYSPYTLCYLSHH